MKKQIGHSPDLCDAVALAVYAMNHSEGDTSTEAERASAVADRYLRFFNTYN